MRLVGYLYEDYHDARSLEHKVRQVVPFIVYLRRNWCTDCRTHI
jgi:hypothetical protein